MVVDAGDPADRGEQRIEVGRVAQLHVEAHLRDPVGAGLGVSEAASHADSRTTMRYDRGRQSLDRHATYIVATFVAGASR
jgi:hypothetical protein